MQRARKKQATGTSQQQQQQRQQFDSKPGQLSDPSQLHIQGWHFMHQKPRKVADMATISVCRYTTASHERSFTLPSLPVATPARHFLLVLLLASLSKS
mmetsp:Transcript_23531/g.45708  ORF Transcript_23531/g.45708 Transcript_23531/m.45708 type:complete len:98 (-) Transcript_23531:82-375(-)